MLKDRFRNSSNPGQLQSCSSVLASQFSGSYGLEYRKEVSFCLYPELASQQFSRE